MNVPSETTEQKDDSSSRPSSASVDDSRSSNASNSIEREDDNQEDEESVPPAVVLGGTNEFVRVSHLASIELKVVGTDEAPLRSKRKSDVQMDNDGDDGKAQAHPTGAATAASDRERELFTDTYNEDLEDEEELDGKNNKEDSEENSDDTQNMRILGKCNKDDSAEYCVDPDVDEMIVITTSPYLAGRSAEKNERLFQRTKSLLLRQDLVDENISDDARTVFNGEKNAWALIKASYLIEKSGMLYSQHWSSGIIQGEHLGPIPAYMLILLLVSSRFPKASETELSAICRELDVLSLVKTALEEWGIEEQFPLTMNTAKLHFRKLKRDTYRCAIFVARLASCCRVHSLKKPDKDLLRKGKQALEIIESRLLKPVVSDSGVQDPQAMKRQRALQLQSNIKTAPSASDAPVEGGSSLPEELQPQKKRKRGRPPKNRDPKPAPTVAASLATATLATATDATVEAAGLSVPAKKRGRPPKKRDPAPSFFGVAPAPPAAVIASQDGPGMETQPSLSRRVSKPDGDPTLQQLIIRFERKHAEMGELLGQIKDAAAKERSKTEQQIRREVLEEVQQKLMDSLPKT